MKKLKNGSHFANIDCTEKFQITDPPKVWVSGFLRVDGNGISASAIMKKLKNVSHFVNIDRMEKFQITDSPKVWVSGFLGVDRNQISASANGSFFPVSYPRFHFNIYTWLHLKHLCVVYPTSHLCVVLHFLILITRPLGEFKITFKNCALKATE